METVIMTVSLKLTVVLFYRALQSTVCSLPNRLSVTVPIVNWFEIRAHFAQQDFLL